MMLPLLVDFRSKYGVAELLTYMGVNPRGARGAWARNILAEGAQPLAGSPNISAPQTEQQQKKTFLTIRLYAYLVIRCVHIAAHSVVE